jgi:cytochrome c-type biogenesis protein CcmH/NrfF
MRRAAVTLLAALALATPAIAATPRTSLPDVEDEVMCVSCNVALNIAESPQADRERAQIRALIAQGMTKDEVKDELVEIYGKNVLALPDDDGFGIAAYVVPIALAAVLVGLLLVLLPRWRRRGPQAATVAPPLSTDDERRLDADLARYDT